jgi:hypothetical protein
VIPFVLLGKLMGNTEPTDKPYVLRGWFCVLLEPTSVRTVVKFQVSESLHKLYIIVWSKNSCQGLVPRIMLVVNES